MITRVDHDGISPFTGGTAYCEGVPLDSGSLRELTRKLQEALAVMEKDRPHCPEDETEKEGAK